METIRINPKNFEEKVIWTTIVGTYGFYFIGALYVVVPVMAWVLCAYGIWRIAFDEETVHPDKAIVIPWSVMLWLLGMMLMLFSLVVGHINNGLGIGSTIKSIIGWAKGWALLAVFPFIGCLAVRPEIIYRAACMVGLQTLLLLPLFVGSWALGLPQTAFVSPFKIIGGPGPEFFAVSLYELEPGTGAPRWRFFTPWAPAIGFVANIYFIFALQEKNIKWRCIGIVACIVMIVMSKSRLAMVSLASVWAITWMMTNFSRPVVLYIAGVVSTFAGMIAVNAMDFANHAMETFKNARADSSRVRSALARIAVDRWQREAPVWGHGVVERGPHIVEYMPIGSHHTWYGLLFVKGMVGFVALAGPMTASFFHLWVTAMKNDTAKVGLSIVLILFLYTFGENLEILPYLTWPGLIFIGLGVNHTAKRNSQPVIE